MTPASVRRLASFALPAALAVLSLCATAPRARADETAKPAAESGVVFESGTPKFADVLAKAKAASKPVFIDFYTDWCGWCKKLDKDVYTLASVADVMNGFVNVKVDAEKGEGPDLAKKYTADGFPTLVIVDAEGAEIDRVVGYLPADKFTKEMQRILRGEGTLPALKKQVEAHPDDLAAALELGVKVMNTDRTDGMARLEAVAEKAKGKDKDLEAKALMTIAQQTRDPEKAIASFERIVKDFGDTPAAAEAGSYLIDLSARTGDFDKALAYACQARAKAKDGKLDARTETMIARLHSMAAGQALARAAVAAGDDAQMLNEVAWSAFEQKVAVQPAVGWARKAVELSKRDPAILDTLANLLYLTLKFDEAMALEQEAFKATKEPRMKAEFGETLAKWKAGIEFRKALGGGKAEAGKAGEDEDGEDDEDGEENEGHEMPKPSK